MKVLLINPPTPQNDIRIREGRCIDSPKWEAPFTPISLAYIATQIDKIAESKLIDAAPQGYTLEKIFETIKNFNPQLIIFASSTPTAQFDFDWFLPEVKRKFPDIKMATNSIHATVLADKIMNKYQDLDFIICGEPEFTAYELVKAIKENLDYHHILGLVFREKDNQIIFNPARPFIEDIDELGLPAWHKVDFSKYIMPIKNRPFTLINISRGCPHHCTFCISHVYAGYKVRKRKPEKIIEEIKLLNNLGVYDFLFWTEFLTADSNYLNQILNLIFKEKLDKKINWVTNSRTDYVDLELLKRLKKAGCWQIVFGLEFGTDEMLKRVNKGGSASVETSKRAVKMANQAGLVIDGHFILGYPGEKLEQIEKTIKFALNLPLTFAHFYAASPFPGSKLYEEAVEEKMFDAENWQKVFLSTPSINTREFNVKKIESIIHRAYKRFYLRPQILYRILKIPKNFKEYKSLFNLGFKFLTRVVL